MHAPLRSAPRRSGRHKSRGQSLAEFALVLPVFMLIVGGIIQFGLIFWSQNSLNQIARDTGRWAASQQSCTNAEKTLVIGTANSIANQSSLFGYSSSSPWTSANVTVTYSGSTCPSSPPSSNQDVDWVTITIQHQVPIFFPWIPGNGNISTTTQFRMEPMPQ